MQTTGRGAEGLAVGPRQNTVNSTCLKYKEQERYSKVQATKQERYSKVESHKTTTNNAGDGGKRRKTEEDGGRRRKTSVMRESERGRQLQAELWKRDVGRCRDT